MSALVHRSVAGKRWHRTSACGVECPVEALGSSAAPQFAASSDDVTCSACFEQPDIINVCTCCGATYTQATWLLLPCIGTKEVANDDGVVVLREDYRNCACGSTRMVFTPVSA